MTSRNEGRPSRTALVDSLVQCYWCADADMAPPVCSIPWRAHTESTLVHRHHPGDENSTLRVTSPTVSRLELLRHQTGP